MKFRCFILEHFCPFLSWFYKSTINHGWRRVGGHKAAEDGGAAGETRGECGEEKELWTCLCPPYKEVLQANAGGAKLVSTPPLICQTLTGWTCFTHEDHTLLIKSSFVLSMIKNGVNIRNLTANLTAYTPLMGKLVEKMRTKRFRKIILGRQCTDEFTWVDSFLRLSVIVM